MPRKNISSNAPANIPDKNALKQRDSDREKESLKNGSNTSPTDIANINAAIDVTATVQPRSRSPPPSPRLTNPSSESLPILSSRRQMKNRTMPEIMNVRLKMREKE